MALYFINLNHVMESVLRLVRTQRKMKMGKLPRVDLQTGVDMRDIMLESLNIITCAETSARILRTLACALAPH